jgi:hypothetical protein
MTNWIVRGQAALLAASRAQDIVGAKREWRMTYAYEESTGASCELCGHPRLRHKFEIENGTTGRHLWVGSECIKKFVPVYENGVEVQDEARRGTVVDGIVASVRSRDRQFRAFALLDALAERDRRFRDESWRENWQLGYSVKQLQLIAIAAKHASVPFSAANLRINTRRGRVMEQLYQLKDWQYRQLRAALTPSRRGEVDAYFGFNVRLGGAQPF